MEKAASKHQAAAEHHSSTPVELTNAGLGTVLLLLVRNMPESNAAKSWLIILVPGMAAVFSWMVGRMQFFIRRRQLRTLRNDLDEKKAKFMANPKIPPELITKIEQTTMQIDWESIKSLINQIDVLNKKMASKK